MPHTSMRNMLSKFWVINGEYIVKISRPNGTNQMVDVIIKVIPGEAGFRTDCFKIWVYNTKDILLLTSIVVSCPSSICLLSI